MTLEKTFKFQMDKEEKEVFEKVIEILTEWEHNDDFYELDEIPSTCSDARIYLERILEFNYQSSF